MTRIEQIDEFAYSQVDCEFFNEDLYEGIVIGAKWADEHPKEGMVSLDKISKWLRSNIDLYANTRPSLQSGYQEVYLTDDFEKNFRKAMEG